MNPIATNTLEKILTRALTHGPDPTEMLHELHVSSFAVLDGETLAGSDIFAQLLEHCFSKRTAGTPNDPILQRFGTWVSNMDAQVNNLWMKDTLPNTSERREVLGICLNLSPEGAEKLNFVFPPFLDGNTLIADKHTPWYTYQRKHQQKYYWPSVLNYLAARGIPQESITMVDQASDQLLDYISDPKSDSIYGARGLVVGYVQSGKTTNINVLIAKSIDAGYRLIIVFAGLTDVLRTQTQRRLDKEVVGKILLETDPSEAEDGGYFFHKDWSDFIEHEPQPGHPIGPKIERLTTREFDFSKGHGAAVFTDGWANSESSARVVIIKKNAPRLRTLKKELSKMSQQSRENLPVLIIDDESDQASINTINPSALTKSNKEKRKKLNLKEGEKLRTAVNLRIKELLLALPRAQYIGYTATPFANVLINPDDPEDLFPKDFVYALTQPIGYMGVKDFHDLDDEYFPIDEVPVEISKKAKHVRQFDPRDDAKLLEQLQQSIDAFVLSGALKLYRELNNPGLKFRHHTMFYTDSTGRKQHEQAREFIEDLWFASEYNAAAGMQRLATLFAEDFQKFSEDRDNPLMMPTSFNELRDFIPQTIQRINSHTNGHARILVVNSDNTDMSPNFETDNIWKIIIGGAKLSRGYTIEGLTTTFFRRSTKSSATLLQMGRWFGYRNGYKDLVRLYISKSEKLGAQRLDLYSAFESICRDEEAFRRELRRYSIPQPDGTRLTPRQIAPLVQNTHPQLKPDQPNKMWNAVLTSRNFGSSRIAFGSLSIEDNDVRNNSQLFLDLFKEYEPSPMEFGKNPGNNPFLITRVPHERILSLVEQFRRPKTTDEEKFFKSFLAHDEHKISDWLIAMPQVGKRATPKKWSIPNGIDAFTVERSFGDGRFTTVGEDRHRIPCYQIAGIKPPSDPITTSDLVAKFSEEEQLAVLLLYPMHVRATIENPKPPVLPIEAPAMGIEFFLPKNKIPLARFVAARPDNPHRISVEAPGTESD
jgi:hypothetical protein